MKTFLRALAVGAFAVAATPTLAADLLQDPPIIHDPGPQYVEPQSFGSGYLEGSYEHVQGRNSQPEKNRWAIRGSHAVTFSQHFNIQVDGEYAVDKSSCCDDSDLTGTLHLFTRDPHRYALGAYGHLGQVNGLNDKKEDISLVGLEAAAFLGQFTLMGQVGRGTIKTATQSYSTVLGTGTARYYINDNLRLNATLSLDDTELTNASSSSTHFGVHADWRMAKAPLTLFAGYRFEREKLDVNGVSIDPVDSDVFFVGARFHWGSKSLKDEERRGTLWAPVGRIGN